MPESLDARRRYTDKEIGTLIQRATELQEQASEPFAHTLSLQDIEHIAAEIGIDPAHLRAAATELESRQHTGESFGFWGWPFTIDLKRAVEGTLTEEQWEHIVLEIRRLTGSVGQASEIGRTREWTAGNVGVGGHIQVAISPRDDHAIIQAQKQYREPAAIAYMLTFFFSTALAGILLDGGGLADWMNFAIAGGSGVGGLLAMRTAMAYWAKRQKQNLSHLVDYLSSSLSSSPVPVDELQPLVELPDPIEEPESSAPAPNIKQGIDA